MLDVSAQQPADLCEGCIEGHGCQREELPPLSETSWPHCVPADRLTHVQVDGRVLHEDLESQTLKWSDN